MLICTSLGSRKRLGGFGPKLNEYDRGTQGAAIPIALLKNLATTLDHSISAPTFIR
jgi:hypothetical protein